MPIICKICQQQFDKIIPWQHLRQHGITTKEYRQQHGPVYSDETLNKMRSRVPHNLGKTVTDPQALAKIRAAVDAREHRYQSGEITRSGRTLTEDQRQKISKSIKEYAASNPQAMRARAEKAVITKKEKNYDFTSSFKGRHHDEQAKKKISDASKLANLKKQHQRRQRVATLLDDYQLALLNDIDSQHMQLRCLVCGHEFSFTAQYFTPSKTKPELCTQCHPRHIRVSRGEQELFEFVKTLEPTAVTGYRTSYHEKEIDIFVPNKNIGIEFNGLYWHSEAVMAAQDRSPKSDYEKFQKFLTMGIRIFCVFEDEWHHHADIVKSRVANLLGHTADKIHARKCEIRQLTSDQASDFFTQTHIMGNGRSNIRLGLFYQDQLVSAMSFVNNNLSRKSTDWEINRFSSKLNTAVVGGASRLFSHFLTMVDPTQVISYADARWSDGGLYRTLGFNQVSTGTPNYWYVPTNELTRIHRFTLRKTADDRQDLTEYENRLNQGFNRIWDYGSSKWRWQK